MSQYENTHTKILNGALFFLKKNDAIKFNLDDLAEYLKISKKTLYNHFKDKEDLIFNVFLYDSKETAAEFIKLKEKNLNPLESIHTLLFRFYYIIKERVNILVNSNNFQIVNENRYKTIILESDKTVRMILCGFIKEAQNLGYIEQKFDVQIVTQLLISNIKVAFHVSFKDPIYNIPCDTFFDNSFEIILRGIMTKQGIELFSKYQSKV